MVKDMKKDEIKEALLEKANLIVSIATADTKINEFDFFNEAYSIYEAFKREFGRERVFNFGKYPGIDGFYDFEVWGLTLEDVDKAIELSQSLSNNHVTIEVELVLDGKMVRRIASELGKTPDKLLKMFKYKKIKDEGNIYILHLN